jgi:hypothetical protein
MAIVVNQGPNVNVSKLNDNQEEATVAIEPSVPEQATKAWRPA